MKNSRLLYTLAAGMFATTLIISDAAAQSSGGSGSRILDGLEFQAEKSNKLAPGNLPEIAIIHTPNDSFLYIRGTIHAAGYDYFALSPKLDSLNSQLRDNAPEGCRIYFEGDTQQKGENHFLVRYLFEDTRHKPDCWHYFQSLDKLDVSEEAVGLLEYKLQFRPETIEIVDTGPHQMKVGPMIVHQIH